MIERNGDVFDTDCAYIGHGVNTEGVMGAGIAKTVRARFPNVYKEYLHYCREGLLVPGGTLCVSENGRFIVNMATQRLRGRDARYEHVFAAAYESAKYIKMYGGGRMAIPEIGCGIGGLQWPKVKVILECIEQLVPGFEFEVWHYGTDSTQG